MVIQADVVEEAEAPAKQPKRSTRRKASEAAPKAAETPKRSSRKKAASNAAVADSDNVSTASAALSAATSEPLPGDLTKMKVRAHLLMRSSCARLIYVVCSGGRPAPRTQGEAANQLRAQEGPRRKVIAPALSRFRFDWLLIDLLWIQAPRRAQARHRPSGLSLLDTKDLGLDFRREFIKRGHIIMSAITNDDHCTITNTTKSILIYVLTHIHIQQHSSANTHGKQAQLFT